MLPQPDAAEPVSCAGDLLDALLLLDAQAPQVWDPHPGPPAAAVPRRARPRPRTASTPEGLELDADTLEVLVESCLDWMVRVDFFDGLDAGRDELRLVAALARSLVDEDGVLRVRQLATRFGRTGRGALELAGRVRELEARRVLVSRRSEPARSSAPLGLVGLLHREVRLSERSQGLLFQEDGPQDAEAVVDPDLDPLEEAFRLVKPLRELLPANPRHRTAPVPPGRRAVLLTAFGARWARLLERCRREEAAFPLGELAAEAGLDEAETAVLVYLVEETLADAPCSVAELTQLVSGNSLAALGRPLFRPGARLVERRLVMLEEDPVFRSTVVLAPWVRTRLAGEAQEEQERLACLLEGDGLLELDGSSPAWESLVLGEGVRGELEELAQGLDERTRGTLRAWGLEGGGRAQGRVVLFHGPSGTGKTLAARALAGRLQVPVLATDCARVLSRWVGESQQNVAGIFRLYRRAARELGRPPLLLLDEADQLLGTRQPGGEPVDRMFSQMQNLFLEALDSFEGLLVATTNLPNSLDRAFHRRFDAKLAFPRPGREERRRLWEIHLPAGVPRLEDLELETLSGLDLGGGQIAVAARRAVQRAAVRGDGLRREDLREAARRELEGAAALDGGLAVGFGRA